MIPVPEATAETPVRLAALAAFAKLSIPLVHRAASHPDSARAVAEAVARARRWAELSEGWRDFFLLSGTAAVTLAGLLFVAISLHIEALVHETRRHLLALARAILLSFVLVLTLSLMMLVPGLPLRPSGGEFIAVGLVGLVITVRQLRTGVGTEHPDFSSGVFRRRLILPLVGYAWLGMTGVGMAVLRSPESLYWSVGGISLLLGNAVGASWDLLVRTARIRRRDAHSADR